MIIEAGRVPASRMEIKGLKATLFLLEFFVFLRLQSIPKTLHTFISFIMMGSLAPALSFNVLRDTKPDDTTLPAFMVSTTRGFLPRQEPITRLPSEFDKLESILTRMPIKTVDGTPGLLATYTLGETVLEELPDLTGAINKYKDNLPLMNALYRDYSFLASAYLLEPCHERFVKGEGYGLGRQTLPSAISLPISKCAEL
jgi:indoleamine 2,3-dioxygenase